MTSSDEDKVLGMVPRQVFIDGQWRSGSAGRSFEVEDPATGAVLTEVADADAGDAVAALDAAAAAQPAWAATAPRRRGEILRRAYESLMDRIDDLALLMTLEMGKPIGDSKAEITYAADFFRWFAEEAVRIDGRYTVSPNGQGRILVTRQPVGPCVLITPTGTSRWRWPPARWARRWPAGCTMVLRPAWP